MASARIAPAARDDLRDIRSYSKSAFGLAAARTYLLGLRAVIVLVGQSPMAGIAEEDLGKDIRSFPYRSHRVYYRARPADVLIVRILHHARDVPRPIGNAA